MRALLFVSVAAVAATLATLAPAQNAGRMAVNANALAVADAGRPAADKAVDDLRKPGVMLDFARVRPGQRIGELLPGGGYFTRIFSKAVGPKGMVLAILGPPPANGGAGGLAPVNAIATAPGYQNVVVVNSAYATMAPPASLDLVWTSRNYHDLKNRTDITTKDINDAVFRALKPGGTYIVLDHASAPGTNFTTTSTLHRIDGNAVKAEVLTSGFVFDGESNVLRHPADDHTKRVFEQDVRGKTDQFILRFRKPR